MKSKSFASIMAALLIILVVLVVLLLRMRGARRARPEVLGGLPPRIRGKADTSVVVDTLNLTHALREGARQNPLDSRRSKGPNPLTTCEIVGAIDASAADLRKRYPDRVMYVTKDRDTAENLDRDRAIYSEAARRNGVYVYVVERYKQFDAPFATDDGLNIPVNKTLRRQKRVRFEDEVRAERAAARSAPNKQEPHATKGRDDFLIGLLAFEWRAPVVSKDRFRDFEEVRASVKPFHVYLYSPFARADAPPERLYINPQADKYRGLRKPRTVWIE